MDISLAPKLIAAAVVGAAVANQAARLVPVTDAVMLKMEWIQEGKEPKNVEAITLRTLLDKPTTLRQGGRTIEATPVAVGDGSYNVTIKLTTELPKGVIEILNTEVHVLSGETNVVMGATKKNGKSTEARLFFLTAQPL